ncbi:MAG: DUF3575 domain-containing protein, partial [Muribaculaceae bacterium]|nr:DUF3575 domain-containing protein [Muribaculaceae bacterium]
YDLSDRRAEKILDEMNLFNPTENPDIEISFVGRDWNMLYNLAMDDPALPFKDETLALLKKITDNLAKEASEKESDNYLSDLKSLRDGIPYEYLYNHIFPTLRASRVYLTYYSLPMADFSITSPSLSPGTLPEMPAISYQMWNLPKEGKNFYMALKSNVLYDILALPSISAEFYLGKDFSAVANWTYGWWDTDRTHHYWRAYGGDLAFRWWFGKKAMEKPLTGHHLGVYGGILTYDFEFGGTGYMGGLPHETLWNRSLRMAGIEYGYSLPIARRLNIDFTIGIGYLGGKYIKYIPDNGRYLWQSTHKINWFGPTKAEISLVWLIGNGNYNSSNKRGGSL